MSERHEHEALQETITRSERADLMVKWIIQHSTDAQMIDHARTYLRQTGDGRRWLRQYDRQQRRTA